MMSKSEIISLTLDQLLDRYDKTPESFEYVGDDSKVTNKVKLYMDNIIWQTKIPSGSGLMDDPLNEPKTIVVTYSDVEKSLTVRIFNKTFETLSAIEGQRCDAHMEYRNYFMPLRANYRKYLKLKQKIFQYQQREEAKSFLRKLSNIFPTALDSHIFGE